MVKVDLWKYQQLKIDFFCWQDQNENIPSIMKNVQVDLMPPLLKYIICHLISWQILLKTCVPDSCIINKYDESNYISLHIDHKDVLHTFCSVFHIWCHDSLWPKYENYCSRWVLRFHCHFTAMRIQHIIWKLIYVSIT